MVGENQVRSPTLDGETTPQPVGGNGGAFHMPAGPARPKRGIPRGFTLPGHPPQEGIQRVPLAGAIRVAATFGK